MLKTKEEVYEKTGVGVIVGRFQVDELHEGHIDLIQSVYDRHDKLIIVLGLAAVRATKNNPLDFEARRKMIMEAFPDHNIEIAYNQDTQSNKDWSTRLDKLVRTHSAPGSDITLYGSRDSFLKHYEGKLNTKELVQRSFMSGTKSRTVLSNETKASSDFRHGVIWAVNNQYDIAYMAVDIAILDEKQERILLAKKPGEDKFRLVGGFVDPSDNYGQFGALESNARREVAEETGVEIGDIKYIGSSFVNDWRYRSEKSKIMSILFKATYMFGKPTPMDDIEMLQWIDINTIDIENDIMDVHQSMMTHLIETIKVVD
jgi:bifunctional NMN adenylyltransferase/nudix hydrolase